MVFWYSARRLMGSRLIESAAYCNHIWLAHLFINSTQNTSVNWIIRLLLSLLCWPKVILLSGGHCTCIRVNKSIFGNILPTNIEGKPLPGSHTLANEFLFFTTFSKWRHVYFGETSDRRLPMKDWIIIPSIIVVSRWGGGDHTFFICFFVETNWSLRCSLGLNFKGYLQT